MARSLVSADARPKIALTIAGSDSGGGAGIQADLKTFHARGVHGLSVISAITAQNTRGVDALWHVPARQIEAQLQAVFEDFPIAAVKIGMLGSASITRLVARQMRLREPPWLVLDPVMIASSGARLLDDDAISALIRSLLPLADVLTPNIPEAETLLGQRLHSAADFDRAGTALMGLGAKTVVLKGGHGHAATVMDRVQDARGRFVIRNPRCKRQGHGTGCTLSSAIAAELAKGRSPRQAVRIGIAYVQRALRAGYQPGAGSAFVLRH